MYIDDDKLLEKYQTIRTKIEGLQSIERNPFPVCNDRYIKTKIVMYGDNVYTNFRGLNVPENGVECEFLTIISIDSSLIYENEYYLQVYWDSCAYKIVDKQIIDYLEYHRFDSDAN